MQFNAVFLRVSHPETGILIAIKTGKGQFLEAVHHILLLVFAGRVTDGEVDDPSPIAPLMRAHINQVGHNLGVTTKNPRQRIVGDMLGLTTSITDQVAICTNCRSMPTSPVVTRTAVFNQRVT
jgi:hypothetical protein